VAEQTILLSGSYGHGNTGDEAILSSLVAGLRRRRPGLRILVAAGDTEAVARRHGVEAVPWDDWAAIAEAVRSAGLVLEGGGGLFFDGGTFDPRDLLRNGAPDLAHYASLPLLARICRTPLFLCACGVGPLAGAAGRRAVRLAFALSRGATVRDAESRELLESIGFSPERVEVTADPAFAMPAIAAGEAAALLASRGIDPGRPVLAVAPRAWAEPDGASWEGALARGIAEFARREGFQVLLLCLHPGHDDGPVERLARELALFSPAVLGPAAPEQIAGAVARCDLLTGMRLHSILFAVAAGTPAVALSYAPKVRALMRRTGHEELCLELSAVAAGLPGALSDAWARREEIRGDFRRAARGLRSEAERNLDLALAALDAPESRAPELSSEETAMLEELLGAALAGRIAEIREKNRLAARTMELSDWGRSLSREVASRDETIRSLQAELHGKVAECNEVIRGLQDELRRKDET
jgi:polysaccharide pyruvyl transferase CsaB